MDWSVGMSEGRDDALAHEILRGVVGSTSHGTAIDGQDDRDEMGVFVELPERVCGMRPLDHYLYRDQPNGVRSQPGDLDLVLYSLRKYCRLAAQGNPSVLILLWLPSHEIKTELGQALIDLRQAFVSREAGERFLGYLISQRMALTGERSKKVSRPELVEKYGYDTKFAMHALRLGFEGIEYMTSGRLTLPVAEPNLSTLRALRCGEYNFADALGLINTAEERLRAEVDKCQLVADRPAIDRFLVSAHLSHWGLA